MNMNVFLQIFFGYLRTVLVFSSRSICTNWEGLPLLLFLPSPPPDVLCLPTAGELLSDVILEGFKILLLPLLCFHPDPASCLLLASRAQCFNFF